jgi:N-acetylglucosamine kinase-like BadF-type ATPase
MAANPCYTKISMFAGVDIGGSKTLVATFNDGGIIA